MARSAAAAVATGAPKWRRASAKRASTQSAPNTGGTQATLRSMADASAAAGVARTASATSQSKVGVQIGFAPSRKLMYESVARKAGNFAIEYSMRRRW